MRLLLSFLYSGVLKGKEKQKMENTQNGMEYALDYAMAFYRECNVEIEGLSK